MFYTTLISIPHNPEQQGLGSETACGAEHQDVDDGDVQQKVDRKNS